jgi:hypothetical protein
MARDQYLELSSNLRSIGLAIEAMRQLARHGGAVMTEKAFAGFAALPAPRSCWDILGLEPDASPDEINAAFRRKATVAHPDAGGSTTAMAELSNARDEALQRGPRRRGHGG